MKSNSKLIVFLDRQKIIFVGPQLSAALTLDLPPTLVFDLEVVDPEGVNTLLLNFVEQNKIFASEIIIITSEAVYYQQDGSTLNDLSERKKQTDQFLATVPFKNLISKDYTTGTSTKSVALNKDFYEPIVRFFEKSNFNVVAILPLFIIERFHLTLTAFSSKEAKEIFQKYKLLESYSLITAQDIKKSVSTPIHHQKQDQGRTLILLSVFLLLIIILLGFVFLRPMLMKNSSTKVIQPTALVPTTAPTQTPTPTITYLATENIRIKVINSSGTANQAAKLKQNLSVLDVKEITTASAPNLSAAKNKITYNLSVSPEILEKINTIVDNLVGPSTLTQSPDLVDVDIQITTVIKTNPQISP